MIYTRFLLGFGALAALAWGLPSAHAQTVGQAVTLCAPTTNNADGTWRTSCVPDVGFTDTTPLTPLSASNVSSSATLTSPFANVIAQNVGAKSAYCQTGATATTSGIFIPSGGSWNFRVTPTTTKISCITSGSDTTTINLIPGSGSGGGAGGGSSGGGGATSNVNVTQWNGVTVGAGSATGSITASQVASLPLTGTLQSAATGSGNGTPLTVTGDSSAILTVNCAACSGGTTVSFQITQDGSNWTNANAVQIGTNTIASSTTTAGVTIWELPIAGAQQIRTPVGSYSAGTITVTAAAVPVAYNPKVVTANQGTSPWVGNTTQWASGTLGAMANYGTSPGAVLVPGVNAYVTNTNGNGAAVPGSSAPVVGAIYSHASVTSLANNLVVKNSAGDLGGFNCTDITGGVSGFCIAYNATSAPAPGALTGANVLDACYIDTTARGCSLSHINGPVAYGTGIVILLSSASSPFTYTTGTLTAFISADYF